MIGRGSRAGRKERRIMRMVGRVQFDERTKHGLLCNDPKDPRILRVLRSNLDAMALQKSNTKRLALAEKRKIRFNEAVLRIKRQATLYKVSDTAKLVDIRTAAMQRHETDIQRKHKPRRRREESNASKPGIDHLAAQLQ